MTAGKQPRPVLTAASIAGLVTAVAGIVGFLGYTNAATNLSAQSQTLASLLIGLLAIGGHVAAALTSERKVTPLASPRDADLVPLVRQPYQPAHAATPAPVDPESAAGERLDMIPDPPTGA